MVSTAKDFDMDDLISFSGFWTGRKIVFIYLIILIGILIAEIYLLSTSLTLVQNFQQNYKILSENPLATPPYANLEGTISDKFNTFFFGASSSCSGMSISNVVFSCLIVVLIQPLCICGSGTGLTTTVPSRWARRCVRLVIAIPSPPAWRMRTPATPLAAAMAPTAPTPCADRASWPTFRSESSQSLFPSL